MSDFKVTPAMVKELRELSAAGMLDCKNALEATKGDVKEAIKWLREKGISKAEKKASRVAAEGLCNAVVNGNEAVIYELNSETDFVAKNDKFLNLIAKIGEILIKSKASNDVEALAVVADGKTVNEIILENSATIGEKISLRRVQRITKASDEAFGVYKHQGGRIVAVVTVKGNNNEAVAKDVALHVAALSPKSISEADVDQKIVAEERKIIETEIMNENATAAKPKPQNIIDVMVEGRVKKFLKESCLVYQSFIKDPSVTVGQFLTNSKTEAVNLVRVEVGEGIEKQVVDFAAEVAAQVKGA